MDFAVGGLAAVCAGVFTNPLDVIKTRQQLQGELLRNSNAKLPYSGFGSAINAIVKADGLRGLQKGFGPALSFQFLMNSTRLGLFQTADDLKWTCTGNSDIRSPILLVFWGGVSGFVGATVGCPLYMVKTQLQSQSHGQFTVGHQHQHNGAMSALSSAYRNNGVRGLWRGLSGIVPLNMIASAIQMTTFAKSKEVISNIEAFQHSTVLTTAIISSMVTGVFFVMGITPFDVVATRMFNQGVDTNGKGLLYRNVFDCFVKTFQIEGIRGLYKGLLANYVRQTPHTILSLTFWEQFKELKILYIDKE